MYLEDLEPMKKRQILKVGKKDREGRIVEDILAEEVPLTIHYNGEELATLLCSPWYEEDLAVGYLFSEGFIESGTDVFGVFFHEDKGVIRLEGKEPPQLVKSMQHKRTVTSGCGGDPLFYRTIDAVSIETLPEPEVVRFEPVPWENIQGLLTEMQRQSQVFLATGATHCAAIASADGLELIREDIGRHNAVEKVVGACLNRKIDVAHKLMLCTGRISSEMLLKTARIGVPILVSHSAPTHLAVEMAERLNLTLIGFARGHGMNVYTHPQRISFNV